jgi:WD40 repeat protein
VNAKPQRLATFLCTCETSRLWSVATGRSESVLQGHDQLMSSIAWSPDGKTLATGSHDQSIRLWNADGSFRRAIADLDAPVRSLTFTPDSKELLFTRGANPTSSHACSLLEVDTGKERLRLSGHTNTVQAGSISADGAQAVAVGGDNNEILLWKLADGSLVSRMAGRGKSIWATGWSKDGQVVAWGHSKAPFLKAPLERTFDLRRLEFVSVPDATFRRAQLENGPLSLAYTPANTVSIKEKGTEVGSIKFEPTDLIHCFTWIPNNLVVVGTGYRFGVYDSRTGQQVRALSGPSSDLVDVSVSADDHYLVCGSNDQTLRIYSLEGKEVIGIGVQFRLVDGVPTVLQVIAGGSAATDGRLKEKDKIVAVENPEGRFVDVTKVKTIAEVVPLIVGPEGTIVRLKVIPFGKAAPVVYKIKRHRVSVAVGRDNPLLSLFTTESDWVAWTPEGYYAASPGGGLLVADWAAVDQAVAAVDRAVAVVADQAAVAADQAADSVPDRRRRSHRRHQGNPGKKH